VAADVADADHPDEVVGDDVGSLWANGYEGQSTLVCPGVDGRRLPARAEGTSA
jgi:hypothetical protein